MAQQRAPTPVYLWPGRSRLLRRPLGAGGVISLWNYPVQIAQLPVLAALAAGNRVMLKPSELTPRTSEFLERIVAQQFAQDEFAVVTGGPDLGDAFSRLPFDHLFSPLDRSRPQDRARRGREPDAGDARVGRQVAGADPTPTPT